MRTRIAQDAVRPTSASVCSSNRNPSHRARRRHGSRLVASLFAGGVTLIAAALIAAASLGPAAGAVHRNDLSRHQHASGFTHDELALAVRARVAMGMRWLTAWRAAHPAAHPAPPPPPAPVVLTDANSTTTPDWACIRLHESSDRFNSPTAPGGAYGFLEGTWLSLGYSGYPYEAPFAVQSAAALFLYDELGWQPWSTRFVCGL